jgi:CBS domain-containing protein
MRRIEKTIAEVLNGRAVPVVEDDELVSTAIEVMLRARQASVLITREGRLVGIFTERDHLNRVLALHLVPDEVPIRDVMTPEPETLRVDDCVSYAINRMALRGFRNIPILDESGSPVAILGAPDIIEHLSALFSELDDPLDADDSFSDWIDLGGG